MSMTQAQIDQVNGFTPSYLPDGTVRATGFGFSEPVASTPYCLSMSSIPGLLAALQDEGISATIFLSAPWKDTGFSFNQQVPWLTFSGGAICNAGLIAEYFNHGVHPFVGSSYEVGLLADIAYRIQQAQAGNPSI